MLGGGITVMPSARSSMNQLLLLAEPVPPLPKSRNVSEPLEVLATENPGRVTSAQLLLALTVAVAMALVKLSALE